MAYDATDPKESTAPKEYDPPEGFDTVDAFLQDMRETFQADVDSDRLNREAQLEDAKFAAGEQWEAQDIAARKGRPCLTINTLPQFVAQIVGDIRINRPSIKVRPAEDADKGEADLREGLIRQIERASDAQGVYADAGQAQVIGGMGNFRVDLDYASDDAFDREIRIKRIPNPLAVVWDRMSIDPTGKDARHCFVTDEMARKDFEKAHPDALSSSLRSDMERSGWCTRDAVRITQYWTMKHKPVTIALLADGTIKDLDKLAPGETPVKTRDTFRKTACMYLTNGFAILAEPVEWPIRRVPIIKVTGWEMWVGERRDRFGIVRFAKDPQRLKNYWRSVAAEKLALAPRQQWLVGVNEQNPQDDFRDGATSGDTVLTYTGQQKPERVDPPQIEAALLNEAALASQDMKDVTGLHDASLGARSNETSGKAINARQREGDVASYIYPDNLRASIREAGEICNDLIPVTYDTLRTVVVLGQDEVAKSVKVNDPNNPESINFGNGKYDIAVDTGPSYSTRRVEAADSMMTFVQALPQVGQVAGDLIAKAQDWPLADDIAERLKRAMPPQITADKDTPPPQPDPAQQAQMQMQQEAATLSLAEQKAKVRQAEANADKAEYEAAEAMAKASMAGVNLQPHAPIAGMTAPPSAPMAPPPNPPAADTPPPNFDQGQPSPEPVAQGQGFPAA